MEEANGVRVRSLVALPFESLLGSLDALFAGGECLLQRGSLGKMVTLGIGRVVKWVGDPRVWRRRFWSRSRMTVRSRCKLRLVRLAVRDYRWCARIVPGIGCKCQRRPGIASSDHLFPPVISSLGLRRPVMFARIVRNSSTLTDSELAILASIPIPSAAKADCLIVWRIACSIVRRRHDSTVVRTKGSFAQRKAVRLHTPLRMPTR